MILRVLFFYTLALACSSVLHASADIAEQAPQAAPVEPVLEQQKRVDAALESEKNIYLNFLVILTDKRS